MLYQHTQISWVPQVAGWWFAGLSAALSSRLDRWTVKISQWCVYVIKRNFSMQPVLACESESLEKSESLSCAGLTQANGNGHHGAYVCSFLWPVVTHQSADPAWENMKSLAGWGAEPQPPVSFSLPLISQPQRSLVEENQQESRAETTQQWLSQRGGSGRQTWLMFLMLLVAFFSIPWEGFEDVNQSVLLSFTCGYPQGTNQETPMLQWYYCGAICM